MNTVSSRQTVAEHEPVVNFDPGLGAKSFAAFRCCSALRAEGFDVKNESEKNFCSELVEIQPANVERTLTRKI